MNSSYSDDNYLPKVGVDFLVIYFGKCHCLGNYLPMFEPHLVHQNVKIYPS